MVFWRVINLRSGFAFWFLSAFFWFRFTGTAFTRSVIKVDVAGSIRVFLASGIRPNTMRDSGKCTIFWLDTGFDPATREARFAKILALDVVMEQETVFGMREIRDAGLSWKESGMRDEDSSSRSWCYGLRVNATVSYLNFPLIKQLLPRATLSLSHLFVLIRSDRWNF